MSNDNQYFTMRSFITLNILQKLNLNEISDQTRRLLLLVVLMILPNHRLGDIVFTKHSFQKAFQIENGDVVANINLQVAQIPSHHLNKLPRMSI